MKYLVIFALVSMLFACQKEEVPTFSDRDGVAFYTLNGESDSIGYSFALNVSPQVRDTIVLKMRVVGRVANYDRIVQVVPGAGTTARAGIEYILPEARIPAGKLMIEYPLIVLKTPQMATTTYFLYLDVAENKDFILGAVGQEPITNSSNTLKMKLSINDRIEQPAYWGPNGNTAYFFGAFSVTKFRFMVQVTGLTEFDYDKLEADDQANLRVKLRNALIKYELANGPLMDENVPSQQVTFPSN